MKSIAPHLLARRPAGAALAACQWRCTTTVNPLTDAADRVGLHRSGPGNRRRAGLPHQPVGEHQGEQPLRWLPQRHWPDADVRAQRRREPRLRGRQHALVNLTQPDQSRMVLKVAGGHNCWLSSASACGDITDDVDPQLGRRGRHAAARRSSCRRRPIGSGPQQELPGTATDRRVGSSFANTIWRTGAWHGQLRALPFVDRGARRSRRSSPAPTSNEAYAAVTSKINLDNPANSRLVRAPARRVPQLLGRRAARPTRRPCWPRSTPSSNGIADHPVDPALVISKAPDAVRRHGGRRRQPLRNGHHRQVRVQDRHGHDRL